jgi:hypothetical protein
MINLKNEQNMMKKRSMLLNNGLYLSSLFCYNIINAKEYKYEKD